MKKPYTRMTAGELADATREFDRPGPAGAFRRMTAAERRRWQRVAKRRGRPHKSPEDKFVRVLVSMHPQLLAAAHRLAHQSGSTLSGLIASHLSAAISKKRRSA